MRIGELERALLERFPASDAESWDRTGMLVGDPEAEVHRVAVALDPSLDSLAFAREHACEVLLTHHPLFLDPPQSMQPPAPCADAVGSRVWTAIRENIAVISFHTALDVSAHAARVLAEPLGLALEGAVLEGLPGAADKGYGRLCAGESMSLRELDERCREAFGRTPRVWGAPDAALKRICLWTGAAGGCARSCLEQGIDALVCGEIKYHEALDALEAGLCIVELGHDVSEQAHCEVLVESAVQAGIPRTEVHLRDLPYSWR